MKNGKTTGLQKWKCLETGFITNPGNLSKYQRARGIDTSKRMRISWYDQSINNHKRLFNLVFSLEIRGSNLLRYKIYVVFRRSGKGFILLRWIQP